MTAFELHGDTLTALRVLAGFSQAELARRSGLSQGHISELERGDKNPRPGTVKKLADALGLPILDLYRPPAEANPHQTATVVVGGAGR